MVRGILFYKKTCSKPTYIAMIFSPPLFIVKFTLGTNYFGGKQEGGPKTCFFFLSGYIDFHETFVGATCRVEIAAVNGKFPETPRCPIIGRIVAGWKEINCRLIGTLTDLLVRDPVWFLYFFPLSPSVP